MSTQGLTEQLAARAEAIRWPELDAATRAAALRHLVDTMGVMIAGSRQRVTDQAEAALAAVRPPGEVPVPGRARRADLLDAVYLAAAASHGLELDDGYRQGSTHPGAVVIPAALAIAYQTRANGEKLLESVVAGYEIMTAIARMAHPDMRRQGFHPTSTSGVFGATVAAARLRGVAGKTLRNALGLAASSASGLFAFVAGGADVKRLHPAHAAREGVFAVLLAEQGVSGPPGVLEGRDGFFQAFTGRSPGKLEKAPPYGILGCYIKPYPCCRHLHPALDALLAILNEYGLAAEEVDRVEVETYQIAAQHAAVGWGDFASSQLSFPYVMATALRFRSVELHHFDDAHRADPATTALCARFHIQSTAAMDERYKHQRPARVRVFARNQVFEHDAKEALGGPERPMSPAALRSKFMSLVGSALGRSRAEQLWNRWLGAENEANVAELIAATAA